MKFSSIYKEIIEISTSDKMLHLLYSILFMSIFMTFFKDLILSSILCFVILIIKEIYDSKQENNFFDWLDITAGLGGIIIYIASLLRYMY